MAISMNAALAAEAARALEKAGGNCSQAARELGIPRETLRHRAAWHAEHGKPSGFDFHEDEGGEPPVEELIERAVRDFSRRAKAARAKEVVTVKARSNEPMALAWLGDPHIDDNGCDWPKLREHLAIIKATPGMYGCNLGDTTNNWVGNLGRLYAAQETSKRTAIRMMEWLFEAIPWFVVIAGNHDLWSGDDSPLHWLQNRVGVAGDWAARFRIAFPNGQSFDVDARHDHPGHSQDNPLHGQMKAKIRHPIAQDADLIIGGHKHVAALSMQEDIRRGRPTWFARARGYKAFDSYARNLGFPEQQHGQAVVSVINPSPKHPMGLCHCFLDVAEAADYLTFLRARK